MPAALAVPAMTQPSALAPPSRSGNTTSPSGSGAFDAIDFNQPPGRRIRRIGGPSGLVLAGASNVVPTKTNFSTGETTTMVRALLYHRLTRYTQVQTRTERTFDGHRRGRDYIQYGCVVPMAVIRQVRIWVARPCS
jgi:hypothetical protein